MTEKTPEETSSKRDAILEAARTLFARKRYEETTIADIARAAGVAVGTVYLYFHNKHEVYTAVALDTEAMIARAFHSPEIVNQPFEQTLRTMVDDLFRISREHMHLISLLQIDMQSSEEVIQHKNAHEDLTQVLAAIFQRAIDRGDLASFDTELSSHFICRDPIYRVRDSSKHIIYINNDKSAGVINRVSTNKTRKRAEHGSYSPL